MYLQLAVVLSLFTLAAGDCAFTQTCYPGGQTCHPTVAEGNQTIPQPFSNEGIPDPQPIQCPMYANATCCNGLQNKALQSNFIGIELGFGIGGNPACVHNLEMLWCAFTCGPFQDQFVTTNGYTQMEAPFGGLYTVLLTNIFLDRYYACGIWESCKKTTIGSNFGSCEEFLVYQVQAAISSGSYSFFNFSHNNASVAQVGTSPIQTRLELVENGGFGADQRQHLSGMAGFNAARGPAGHRYGTKAARERSKQVTLTDERSVASTNTDMMYFSAPLWDCCNYPDANGTANVSSPCQVCQGMCGDPTDVCYTQQVNTTIPPNIDAVDLSPVYGLQWPAVTATYASAILLTIGFYIFNKVCACQRGQANRFGCRNPCEGLLGADKNATSAIIPATPAAKISLYDEAKRFAQSRDADSSSAQLQVWQQQAGASFVSPGKSGMMTSPDKVYYR